MPTEYLEAIEEEITGIISSSDVPEDYAHALNVREWVLRLKPDADWALQIAALGHDLERAIPRRKARRSQSSSFDDFKTAHARNSALIVKEILDKYPLERKTRNRILFLIKNHEFSDSQDSDLVVLKDADSLSFFEVNLPLYAQRHSQSEVLFRMRWGFQKLSKKAKETVRNFIYEDERLNRFLKQIISEEKSEPNC